MNYPKGQSSNIVWQPITDYEDDPEELSMVELRSLHDVWDEQKSRIRRRSSFQQFEIHLKREWAIETGLIERLYNV